ncbi:PH-domain-containing protein [Gigaspora margarita]|uniref:PH-domain-containing protein n=1 Tax=Gigaspora margarita TaxID=4874 RepID=A0A8H4AH01_GIGMA|nr:PH-domain-containing protein [Gigaspora margarita]
MLTRLPSRTNLNTDKDEKDVSIVTNFTEINSITPINIMSKTTKKVETVAKLENKKPDKIIMSSGTDDVLKDVTKKLESNLSFKNKTKKNRSSKEYSLGSGTSNSSMDDREDRLNKQESLTPDLDTSSFTSTTEINDSESSSGSGISNEPDSPPLTLIPSVIEIERGKGSLRRKKSNRSIFSVLSVSLSKDLNKGSLSESEGDPPKVTSPKSPLKSDKILSRSGFSSLSMRKRRSKSAISIDDQLQVPLSPEYSSSDIPEKTSKVGKLLGLTPMEEKILLDKPSSVKISKKLRGPPPLSIDGKHNDKDEKGHDRNRNNSQVISGSSNKINKILGVSNVNDDLSTVDKSNKAGKILGWDDNEIVKKAHTMYMEKVVSEFRSARTNVNSQVTVASIRNPLAFTGNLSKYINTNFVLSKSRSWKRRFFILTKNTLYCFKSNDPTSILMDSFELTANTIVCVSDAFNGRSWVLEVRKDHKPWYLQADNVEDMKVWLAELKATVVKCKYKEQELPDIPNHSTKTIDDDEDEGSEDVFTTPKVSLEIPNTTNKPIEQKCKTFEQVSLPPPPRPIPPPPRSRSRSPSPTTLSSPTHPLSPHLIVNGDVEEFIGSTTKLDKTNSEEELPSRSSSPVETLSPPRTRPEQVIPNNVTYSDSNDTRQLSHMRKDSEVSISSSIQPRRRLSPPIKKEERNSVRQSIPIMMSPNLFKATSHNNAVIGTSLSPPPRSPRSPLPVRSENSSTSITRVGPPPNIPLPLPPPIPPPIPPPRPKCTITQNTVPKTSRIPNDTSKSSIPHGKISSPPPPSRFSQSPRIMMYLPPSLPPPTIPLPPIPAEPTDNDMSVTSYSTPVITDAIIEFPDDDDLDPDYAEELEASRLVILANNEKIS